MTSGGRRVSLWRSFRSGSTVIVAALAITVASAVVPVTPQAVAATNAQPLASGTVERIGGVDRFETAALISAATFSSGVPVAYVATGLNFPDALAGAAASGGQGPILLVSTNSIPSATDVELQRLNPGEIVILGGTGVVSSAVEAALAGYTTGAVTRLSGLDRYATAAAISEATFSPGVPVAYVATGLNFPDALAGGPVAALAGGPILLVGSTVPQATKTELTRLNPGKIVILGGIGAVSSAIQTELAGYTAGTVTRLWGLDRYATAAAVSADSFLPGVPVVYVATGANYPDALAGGPAAAFAGGPVLLVGQDSLPTATALELLRLSTQRIVVLGGTGAVSESVRSQLAGYLAPIAVDDDVTTPEGTLVTIDVLANDIDGNLVPASTVKQSDPSHGVLVNNGDGTFDFTPTTGYVGSDSFIYQVCDATAMCDTATVTIGMLANDAFTSDDFFGPSINTGLWTAVDPDGDSTFGISRSGNQLVIETPAGSRHDAWIDAGATPPITFNAPRLMQPATNTSFEIIAKFQSQMTINEQDQGILVQQDANTFLRFDVFAFDRNATAFAAFIDGGPDLSPYSSVEPLGHQPIWLKVARVGNTWTYSTSSDGTTWKEQLTFDLLMNVTQVGVYAGNPSPSGTPAPPNQVIVDYFFNGAAPITPEDGGGTIFDIWYGDSQKFGNVGNAQKWVDVLGNVDDPDGIASLSFTLNGGSSRPLSIGPDTRRLLMPGDFNAQIPTSDLVVGANTVVVRAVDGLSNVSTKTVTVTWTTGITWPMNTITWNSVTDIQDVAQVVDGQWKVTPAGLLTVDVGYDRLIDIGDVTWGDYEVEVPITIRGLDTVNGYDSPSFGPALGILMGWDGHEDCSVFLETACDPSAQPVWGWWPSGSLGELRWTDTFEGLRLIGFNPDTSSEIAQAIEIGSTYYFRMQVETNPTGPLYSLKIWKDGTTEPATWQLTDQQGQAGDPASGSFLILVHHVDVAVGDVVVTALP